MTAKDRARLIHYTGSTVIEKEKVDEVMEELKDYNGNYSSDFEMNGLVLIERTDTQRF